MMISDKSVDNIADAIGRTILMNIGRRIIDVKNSAEKLRTFSFFSCWVLELSSIFKEVGSFLISLPEVEVAGKGNRNTSSTLLLSLV